MLVALAAIWGSSFLFIKVAVRHLHPEAVVFGRLVFGVATLGIFLLWRREMREAVSALRRSPRTMFFGAVLNVAIPFWLLVWGETRVDSGLAALLQASAPIFTAVFALFFVHTQ